MKIRTSMHLSSEALRLLIDHSDRKGISRSSIAETAIITFLSPDGADRMEAAFARRLDRLTRQMQRLERDVGVETETLALFIRFWLTVTPPLPVLTNARLLTAVRSGVADEPMAFAACSASDVAVIVGDAPAALPIVSPVTSDSVFHVPADPAIAPPTSIAADVLVPIVSTPVVLT